MPHGCHMVGTWLAHGYSRVKTTKSSTTMGRALEWTNEEKLSMEKVKRTI